MLTVHCPYMASSTREGVGRISQYYQGNLNTINHPAWSRIKWSTVAFSVEVGVLKDLSIMNRAWPSNVNVSKAVNYSTTYTDDAPTPKRWAADQYSWLAPNLHKVMPTLLSTGIAPLTKTPLLQTSSQFVAQIAKCRFVLTKTGLSLSVLPRVYSVSTEIGTLRHHLAPSLLHCVGKSRRVIRTRKTLYNCSCFA